MARRTGVTVGLKSIAAHPVETNASRWVGHPAPHIRGQSKCDKSLDQTAGEAPIWWHHNQRSASSGPARERLWPASVSLISGPTSHRGQQGTTPQCCPIFGRGVPKTTTAPTTSNQNGSTPTPGIASRTSPGRSNHCQPSTTNNSAAVTTSTTHPIGGAKLVKAPMTSDRPATPNASASRTTENLRGAEAVVPVDRFSNSGGAEGSDILTVALRLVGSPMIHQL